MEGKEREEIRWIENILFGYKLGEGVRGDSARY